MMNWKGLGRKQPVSRPRFDEDPSSTSVECYRYTNPLCSTAVARYVRLEKPPVAQLLKNFPPFYGTRRFITVFTRVLHWSLSWSRWIQSILPYSTRISQGSILILSSHLLLGLSSGLYTSGFPIRILYAFLFPHACYTPCPSHPLIILIIPGEQYKLWSSSLCSFLHPPITSSLFGPNVLLITLVSNTLERLRMESYLILLRILLATGRNSHRGRC
jgi:hypothetical protein